MNSYKEWSPRDYLAQYYATPGIAQDEKGIFQFVLQFLSEAKCGFSEMLEVGCGPTIHHTLPFIPFIGRLCMSDYLASNLKEIQKWVYQESGAHDWTPYISGVLALEGQASESTTQKRVSELRAKMAELLTCNVLEPQPLGYTRMFPLVTSFYTLECVAKDKDEWGRAMGNVASLVAPDGWLVLSSLHKADKYMVCGKEFPTTNINVQDMHGALIASGFRSETINICVCPCEWGEEGFDSIIVCRAQKERIGM